MLKSFPQLEFDGGSYRVKTIQKICMVNQLKYLFFLRAFTGSCFRIHYNVCL